jgi:isochorismate synthase
MLQELRQAVDDCIARAGRLQRIQWLALRLPVLEHLDAPVRPLGERGLGDPATDALAAFEAWGSGERFYWEQPASGRAVAAQGALFAIETVGRDRFAEASRLVQALFSDLHTIGDSAPAWAGPLLVGGFAFRDSAPGTTSGGAGEWRDFPPGRLVLPECMLVVRKGRAWWSLIHAIVPGARAEAEWSSIESRLQAGLVPRPRGRADEDRARWAEAYELGPEYRVRADRPHSVFRAQVQHALRAVAEGSLDKVVLARSLGVRHGGRFALAPFLDSLRRIYPTCTSFAVDRGRSSFVGATPERLIAMQGDLIETSALAGSAARGRTPEEDHRLGEELCGSAKEQLEHHLVVRGIQEALAEVCEELRVPGRPRLCRVEGIQHLETPITGRLRERFSKSATVLDLVACLHPTPAVGGVPMRAAVEWIDAHEGLDRGWYAGPVGTVDASGGGEFRVALRTALVVGGEARLFAGAGVVQGSDPEHELQETRLKLRALLAPLTDI